MILYKKKYLLTLKGNLQNPQRKTKLDYKLIYRQVKK